MKQCPNRVGRAPVGPIGVHAGAHGERQCGAPLAVVRANRRPVLDEESHGRVPRSPRSDVKRGAPGRNAEVAVALFVQRRDIDAEREQVAHTVGIPVPGKLGEERSALQTQLADELRLLRGDQSNSCLVIFRTRPNEPIDAL